MYVSVDISFFLYYLPCVGILRSVIIQNFAFLVSIFKQIWHCSTLSIFFDHSRECRTTRCETFKNRLIKRSINENVADKRYHISIFVQLFCRCILHDSIAADGWKHKTKFSTQILMYFRPSVVENSKYLSVLSVIKTRDENTFSSHFQSRNIHDVNWRLSQI